MFHTLRAALLCFFIFTGPAAAWVEIVTAETEKAANDARCVGLVAFNDMVHILNAPSDRALMSESEERTAMIDLTRAISDIGRFRVTRGGALAYEAVTRANTPAGRAELSATLDRLSESAITVFFAPYARENGIVRAEVTLLVRRHENGQPTLACTPTVWVDIPVGGEESGIGVGPIAEGEKDPAQARILAFLREYHETVNARSCTELGKFYAPELVEDGNRISRSEELRIRCEVQSMNPWIVVHEETLNVEPLGGGRYNIEYRNTAEVDGQNGGRIVTDWFIDAEVEDWNGGIRYTRVDAIAGRR